MPRQRSPIRLPKGLSYTRGSILTLLDLPRELSAAILPDLWLPVVYFLNFDNH